MGRGAEKSDLALFPSLEKVFAGAAGREDLVDVRHAGDGVELLEVEVICFGALEAALEFASRAGRGAFHGLAAEERFGAIGFERDAQFDFRFAIEVAGGDVEVVDSAVKCVRTCVEWVRPAVGATGSRRVH